MSKGDHVRTMLGPQETGWAEDLGGGLGKIVNAPALLSEFHKGDLVMLLDRDGDEGFCRAVALVAMAYSDAEKHEPLTWSVRLVDNHPMVVAVCPASHAMAIPFEAIRGNGLIPAEPICPECEWSAVVLLNGWPWAWTPWGTNPAAEEVCRLIGLNPKKAGELAESTVYALRALSLAETISPRAKALVEQLGSELSPVCSHATIVSILEECLKVLRG